MDIVRSPETAVGQTCKREYFKKTEIDTGHARTLVDRAQNEANTYAYVCVHVNGRFNGNGIIYDFNNGRE